MARKFKGGKLVLATHNPGKVLEMRSLLSSYVPVTVSAGELGLTEPLENGATFIENATIKALASAEGSGFPAVSDDSGLVVQALGGDPGIYSARWAGPKKDFQIAMQKVEEKLKGEGDRSAEFVSALALAWPDGHVETVEGTVCGEIVWPPKGNNGFGYDPIFVADGFGFTFGELDPVEKHQISHRAVAFSKLVDLCFKDQA